MELWNCACEQMLQLSTFCSNPELFRIYPVNMSQSKNKNEQNEPCKINLKFTRRTCRCIPKQCWLQIWIRIFPNQQSLRKQFFESFKKQILVDVSEQSADDHPH